MGNNNSQTVFGFSGASVVAGFALAFGALCLLLLTRTGLWSDELNIALQDIRQTKEWSFFPLDVLSRKVICRLFGQTDFVYRLPSALAGCAAVWLAGLWALRALPGRAYLCVLYAMVCSPFMGYYSTEGRYYIYLICAVWLVLWSYEKFRSVTAFQLRHLWCLALAATPCAIISPAYMFVGPLILLVLLACDTNTRRRLSRTQKCLILAVACLMVCTVGGYFAKSLIVMLLNQYQRVGSFGIHSVASQRLDSVLLPILSMPFDAWLPTGSFLRSGSYCISIGATFCAGIYALLRSQTGARRIGLSLLFSFLALLAVFSLLTYNRNIYHPRYFAPVVPFATVFVAYALYWIVSKCRTFFCGSICVVLFAVMLPISGRSVAFDPVTISFKPHRQQIDKLLAAEKNVVVVLPKRSALAKSVLWYSKPLYASPHFSCAQLDVPTSTNLMALARRSPDSVLVYGDMPENMKLDDYRLAAAFGELAQAGQATTTPVGTNNQKFFTLTADREPAADEISRRQAARAQLQRWLHPSTAQAEKNAIVEMFIEENSFILNDIERHRRLIRDCVKHTQTTNPQALMRILKAFADMTMRTYIQEDNFGVFDEFFSINFRPFLPVMSDPDYITTVKDLEFLQAQARKYHVNIAVQFMAKYARPQDRYFVPTELNVDIIRTLVELLRKYFPLQVQYGEPMNENELFRWRRYERIGVWLLIPKESQVQQRWRQAAYPIEGHTFDVNGLRIVYLPTNSDEAMLPNMNTKRIVLIPPSSNHQAQLELPGKTTILRGPNVRSPIDAEEFREWYPGIYQIDAESTAPIRFLPVYEAVGKSL